MEKFFKYLGIIFLVIILLIGSLFIYSSTTDIDREKIFIPFIKQNMSKLTTWEYTIYKKLMVESKSQTNEQLKLYLKLFHKLGKYKSMGKPNLLHTNTSYGQDNGKSEYAGYLVPLVFESGEASVYIVLVYRKEEVKIFKIRFNSDKLIQ